MLRPCTFAIFMLSDSCFPKIYWFTRISALIIRTRGENGKLKLSNQSMKRYLENRGVIMLRILYHHCSLSFMGFSKVFRESSTLIAFLIIEIYIVYPNRCCFPYIFCSVFLYKNANPLVQITIPRNIWMNLKGSEGFKDHEAVEKRRFLLSTRIHVDKRWAFIQLDEKHHISSRRAIHYPLRSSLWSPSVRCQKASSTLQKVLRHIKATQKGDGKFN